MTPPAAVPYALLPKATKLAAGPDASLTPSVAPTDPAERTAAPFVWPRADTSKGGTAPQDAPLAPPGTDPARRTLAPFVWPKGAQAAVPNRPVAEVVVRRGDLDPDIALWREVIVSIWPFTGPPTDGIWPKGWMGVDNNAQLWVCTVHGEPGTWQPIGFTSAGVASFNTRTGAVVLTAADVEATGFTSAGVASFNTRTGAVVLTAADVEATGLLTSDANSVNSVNIGNTNTLMISTAALGVGTWILNVTGWVQWGGTLHTVTAIATQGTATATLTGATSNGVSDNGSGGSSPIALTAKVVITSPGQLQILAISNPTTTDIMRFIGYTVVRIG